MPWVVPVMMVAAAVVSAYAAVQQGRAAKAAADYNATIATQNAGIATEQAQAAYIQADREKRLRLGAIAAAAGKSGAVGTSGNVLDVIGDVAAQSEMDKQRILYEGQLKARGFTNTATLDYYTGKQAQQAGNLKAGSELLGGAAAAFSAYSRLPTGGGGGGGGGGSSPGSAGIPTTANLA